MRSTHLFTVVILASIYVFYCAEFELSTYAFPWPDLEFTNTSAVGKVYIGLGPGNESEEFKVNENAENGTVPVFILLFDPETGLPSDQFEGFVTLECELTPNLEGYSRVRFTPLVIRPQTSTVVTASMFYRIEQAGRRTDIRCWGSTTFELSSNTQQFTKALSISEPVPFTVRKRGTVNVCSSLVLVSNTAQTNTSTFVLELSEAVESNDVRISCSSTPASESNSLLLVFPVFVMTTDEIKTQVTYQWDKTAGTGPVHVTCQGQSIGAGQLGQFFFNTSAGPPVLFALDEGIVRIEPSLTRLYSSKLELLLYLDAPVALFEVFFVCQANVVNTTEQAKEIADNPYCTAPSTPAPVLPPQRTTKDTELNEKTTISEIDMNTNITTEFSNVSSDSTTNDTELNEKTTISEIDMNTNMTTEFSNVSSDSTTSPVFGDDATSERTLDVSTESFLVNSTTNIMTTAMLEPTTESSKVWETATNSTAGNQMWRLLAENIVFQPGSIYQQLQLERNAKAEDPTQELIVVTCCAPLSSNQDPKYQQQSAAVLINAQMAGLVNINWTDARSIEVEQTESEILNPAYVEFGPCPCDLTTNTCDINCCCDIFCSDDEKSTFACLDGLPGGRPGPEPDHYCTFEDYDTPDWHPILCVHNNRTAFLGNFFYPKTKIETLTELLPVIDDSTPSYDYKETSPRVPSEELLLGGYKQGFSVMTGLKENTEGQADLYTGTNYRLALPRRGYNGACLKTAPVQYLTDVKSDCVHSVTEEMCRHDSIWSARMYVENTNMTDPACPRSLQVLAQHTSKTVTNTGVNYFCATDLSGYVHSLEKREDILSPTANYKFSYEIPKGREEECEFDDISGVYVCPLEPTVMEDSDALIRCSWDDGYTSPPIPEFDSSTGICHNVVLDVHYNLTWHGNTILELNATMIIGDIAMTTTQTEAIEFQYENRTIINGTEQVEFITKMEEFTTVSQNTLTQIFGVDFFPLYVAPNMSEYNMTDNVTDFYTEERYQRSGNPGYDFEKPVISGVAILNETDGSFHFMDVNDTHRFHLWKPGADGLCQNAESKGVNFGDNEMSSCLLRLNLDDFVDCNYLRRLVLSQQDLLMTSEYVSIVGDPNRNILSADLWFQVLRENLTSIFVNSSEPTTTMEPSVATTTETSTTTTETITTTTETSATTDFTAFATEVISTEGTGEFNMTSENTTATGRPILKELNLGPEFLQGRCINIPAGIHLDIFYTEAGQTEYKPIYNIRGARISYNLVTWQMQCISAEGVSCYIRNETSNATVQTFMASSSVRFVQVPLEKPQPKTRYQLKNEEYSEHCKQDSCWANLLYPFLTDFPGDSRTYTIGFTCFMVLHIIGLYFITRPWS